MPPFTREEMLTRGLDVGAGRCEGQGGPMGRGEKENEVEDDSGLVRKALFG